MGERYRAAVHSSVQCRWWWPSCRRPSTGWPRGGPGAVRIATVPLTTRPRERTGTGPARPRHLHRPCQLQQMRNSPPTCSWCTDTYNLAPPHTAGRRTGRPPSPHPVHEPSSPTATAALCTLPLLRVPLWPPSPHSVVAVTLPRPPWSGAVGIPRRWSCLPRRLPPRPRPPPSSIVVCGARAAGALPCGCRRRLAPRRRRAPFVAAAAHAEGATQRVPRLFPLPPARLGRHHVNEGVPPAAAANTRGGMWGDGAVAQRAVWVGVYVCVFFCGVATLLTPMRQPGCRVAVSWLVRRRCSAMVTGCTRRPSASDSSHMLTARYPLESVPALYWPWFLSMLLLLCVSPACTPSLFSHPIPS